MNPQLVAKTSGRLQELTKSINDFMVAYKSKMETLKEHYVYHNEIDNAVTSLWNQINIMAGSLLYLGSHNFEKPTIKPDGWEQIKYDNYIGNSTGIPTQTELTSFARTIKSERDDKDNPLGNPTKGDTIINAFNNNEWWYNGTEWIDIGSALVTIASNVVPGIVQGTDKKFGVNISIDGTMTVNGLTEINSQLNYFKEVIDEMIIGFGNINEILTTEKLSELGSETIRPLINQIINDYEGDLQNITKANVIKNIAIINNGTASESSFTPIKNNPITITIKAQVAITAGQVVNYRGEIATTTAALQNMGVALHDAAANTDLEVCIFGLARVIYDIPSQGTTAGTWTGTPGGYVTIGTNGRITATGGAAVSGTTGVTTWIQMENISITRAASASATTVQLWTLIR